jgi:hypothetical protein
MFTVNHWPTVYWVAEVLKADMVKLAGVTKIKGDASSAPPSYGVLSA